MIFALAAFEAIVLAVSWALARRERRRATQPLRATQPATQTLRAIPVENAERRLLYAGPR